MNGLKKNRKVVTLNSSKQKELNKKIANLVSKLGSVRGGLKAINEEIFDQHPQHAGELDEDIEALKETTEFLIEEVFEEEKSGGDSSSTSDADTLHQGVAKDSFGSQSSDSGEPPKPPTAVNCIPPAKQGNPRLSYTGYGHQNLELGDELVRRSDADERMQEFMQELAEDIEYKFGENSISEGLRKASVEKKDGELQ